MMRRSINARREKVLTPGMISNAMIALSEDVDALRSDQLFECRIV
jgi:hypothetical protein